MPLHCWRAKRRARQRVQRLDVLLALGRSPSSLRTIFPFANVKVVAREGQNKVGASPRSAG